MRPLVIGAREKLEIGNVMRYAEENVISLETLKATAEGKAEAAGYTKNRVCKIPVGFKVVFSYEMQPAGKTRHISISVDANDKLPNIMAINAILTEFGFTKVLPTGNGEKSDLVTWLEEDKQAINVLELVGTAPTE
jgi:hypothetical protein